MRTKLGLFARFRYAVLAGSVMLWTVGTGVAAGPIIANHTCTDLSEVPSSWIEAAKAQFRLSYGHTSHGSQIVSGMELIKGASGSLYWFDRDGTNGGLSLYDYTPSGDLGNPDRTTWAALTRTMLNTPGNTRNVVMWSWCGQADTSAADIQIYLDLMAQLRADFPNVTFIYMTGHLVGTGESGNLNQRNNQIRAACIATNAVLFDFADIESYDPDGDYFLSLGANDNCDYSGGNWATEWCAAHSGDPLCASCSCAHSQPLNCNLKARAFWWMMARLAGWPGPGTATSDHDYDADGDVDLTDFGHFQTCFNGPNRTYAATGCEDADSDLDGDVDLTDFGAFQVCFNGPNRPSGC